MADRPGAHKTSRPQESKMTQDDEALMYGICPRWAFFEAIVNGEPYVFDLRDVAVQYAIRKQHDMQPIQINPVTMKPFNPKTRARLFERLDKLVDQGRLPSELSVGWH